jgi:hypothetical protein
MLVLQNDTEVKGGRHKVTYAGMFRVLPEGRVMNRPEVAPAIWYTLLGVLGEAAVIGGLLARITTSVTLRAMRRSAQR